MDTLIPIIDWVCPPLRLAGLAHISDQDPKSKKSIECPTHATVCIAGRLATGILLLAFCS